jgi:hypothetical protein
MAFKSMTYERLARTRQVVALVLAAAVLTGVQPEALADESAAKDTHTVLVTGANRGLGLEFARQYKEAGSRVIGTARNPDEAEELAALDVRVMQLDVTNQERSTMPVYSRASARSTRSTSTTTTERSRSTRSARCVSPALCCRTCAGAS